MLFDPLYLIVMLVGLALSGWAAAKTKGAFNRWSQVRTRGGVTGADIARRILKDHGIHDVKVEAVAGTLSDHYDPRSKTLRLSEPVFAHSTVAACGVAAHEVGHAIQDAQGYAPLRFRSAWVPMATIGTNLGYILMIVAMFLGVIGLAWVGVALFACSTIFTLVTLPVEFDASRRALATLEGNAYLTQDEMGGARQVLNAAAMTYVAAFISSLLMLLYWAFRLGLLGGSSQD